MPVELFECVAQIWNEMPEEDFSLVTQPFQFSVELLIDHKSFYYDITLFNRKRPSFHVYSITKFIIQIVAQWVP